MDAPTRLALDARALRVAFVASLGPLPVRGHFTEMQGVLVVPGADIARASLVVEVAAASVTTGLAMRDRHVRGPSFLDVERHPQISFASRSVARENGELRVTGTLTLCGYDRDVVTQCPVTRADGADRSGELTLCGAFDVPIREHGIGIPRRLDVINPIFLVVGRRVRVEVTLRVPATRLLPVLLPALGH